MSASVDELVESYDSEHPLFTCVEQAVLDGLAYCGPAGGRGHERRHPLGAEGIPGHTRELRPPVIVI